MVLSLSLALHANEHHRKVLSEGLSLDGYDLRLIPLAAGEMYSRVFDDPEIDAAEMSIARYARLRSEGRGRFVAVPYYFGRVFPHRCFYVRADSAITSLAELRGLRIGLSEYDHTGHTWARALLEDEYHLPPSAMSWIIARREVDRPPVKQDFVPPSDVDLTYAAPEKTLSQMLLDDEIDVLLNPNLPSGFTASPPLVRRIVENVNEAELDYFRKTRMCPIQHILGIRADLVEAQPWLATGLVKALCESVGAERVVWPGSPDGHPVQVALSGLEAGERNSLESFLRHHHAQGMAASRLSLGQFLYTEGSASGR